MSNAQYPTMVHVIPYFSLLLWNLTSYLGCDENSYPDFPNLEQAGKPIHIAKSVYESRKKLIKRISN